MKLPKLNSAFTFDLALVIIFVLLGIFVNNGFYIAAIPFVILLADCSMDN
jgi:hypothetical protein